MDLAGKIKALEEEFKDVPKVLIRRILCGDGVNLDLAKAMDQLRKLSQMHNAFLNNEVIANSVTEKLRMDLDVPLAVGRNRSALNSWIETGRPHRSGIFIETVKDKRNQREELDF